MNAQDKLAAALSGIPGNHGHELAKAIGEYVAVQIALATEVIHID